MLRFFRLIRQRLLTENPPAGSRRADRFSKYLLYAIGEILLVVIGILIALQVNNWNESRQERSSELNFLSRIREDLRNDNDYFKRRIDDAEHYVDYSKEFEEKLYEKQYTLDDVSELVELFSKFYKSEMMTIQNSTFSEMLYAGKLELLTNEELKSLLLDYYRRSEEVAKHVTEFNVYSVDVFNIMHDKAPSILFAKEIIKKGLTFEEDYGYFNNPSSDKFQALAYAASLYGTKHQVFLDYFIELDSLSRDLINRLEALE